MREPGEELVLARVSLFRPAEGHFELGALLGDQAVGLRLVDRRVEGAVQRLGIEAVLDQVILHARLHRLHGNEFAAGAREHDGREVRRPPEFREIVDEVDPGAVRQVVVEQDAVGLLGTAGRQAALHRAAFDERVLHGRVRRQEAPPCLPVFRAVVDDEDFPAGQAHWINAG